MFSLLVSIRLFQAALDVMRLSSCSLYGLHAIRQTRVHIWDRSAGPAGDMVLVSPTLASVAPLRSKQSPGTSGPHYRTPVVELSFPESEISPDPARMEASHLEVVSGNSGCAPSFPLLYTPGESSNLGANRGLRLIF